MSWPLIPTEKILNLKNYNPDKKVPTMLTPSFPTLMPTPTILKCKQTTKLRTRNDVGNYLP